MSQLLEQRAAAPPTHDLRGAPRFCQYLESVARNGFKSRTPYPGLRARPWLDPRCFPIVDALEAAYPQIAREIGSIGANEYHKEGENIGRSGSWDIFMLYERGRKLMENCARCPVTTDIIDRHDTVRTLAGLIYFSRMRPGTHIARHRGPTNLRLRCHLGIDVPPGDCAIRVDGEARHWETGRCIVFDDSHVHEAWNNTSRDRLVLIVDLWHPDLSPDEIVLLQGMHTFAFVQAYSLKTYWANNARMRSLHDYD